MWETVVKEVTGKVRGYLLGGLHLSTDARGCLQ